MINKIRLLWNVKCESFFLLSLNLWIVHIVSMFFFSFHLCSGFSFPNYSMIHHLRWLIFFSLATYLSMVSMGVIKSKKERESECEWKSFSLVLHTCPLLCGHYDYYIWDFALVFFIICQFTCSVHDDYNWYNQVVVVVPWFIDDFICFPPVHHHYQHHYPVWINTCNTHTCPNFLNKRKKMMMVMGKLFFYLITTPLTFEPFLVFFLLFGV